VGILMRDPRARATGSARDPSLIEMAEGHDGNGIATYFYPAERSGRVPVISVTRATGEALWVADDFDTWFASRIHETAVRDPQAARVALEALGLAPDFPRPLPMTVPPRWFFEAHHTPWSAGDAETALVAGDVEGAERMLIAASRMAPRGLAADTLKQRLVEVYATLGWDHHRATVVETW
jgi:hypothetical protein